MTRTTAPDGSRRDGALSRQPVLIGPANYAGQATAFAEALRTRGGVEARSAGLVVPGRAVRFDADIPLPAARWALDPWWQKRWRDHVVGSYSRVVMDGGLPLTRGRLRPSLSAAPTADRRSLADDIGQLARRGVVVDMLLHGSEIRDPVRHAELFPRSPFAALAPARRAALVRERRHVLRALPLARRVFVTTPDLLLEDVPAEWAPVVVPDHGARASETEPALSGLRPTVLHVTTNPGIAGTREVDEALTALDARGHVRYLRLVSRPHHEVLDAMRVADVVVDKLTLGSYGVLAVEAMQRGRLVLGSVADEVKSVLADRGDISPPILDVTTTVHDAIAAVLDDRDAAQRLATRGPLYASEVHDGRRTADVLMGSIAGHG